MTWFLHSSFMRVALMITLGVVFIASMLFYVTGESLHEYFGAVFGIVALAHLLRSPWWFVNFRRLPRHVRGRFVRVVDTATVMCLILVILSGCFISRFTFPELRVESNLSDMIALHRTAAYWMFLLICMHAALHRHSLIQKFKILSTPRLRTCVTTVFGLWAFYGCRLVWEKSLPNYWFALSDYVNFDAETSFLLTIFEMLSMSAAFCFIAAIFAQSLPGARRLS